MTAHFAGVTYSPEHDAQRLSTQQAKVSALMSDGKWRTLGEIARAVGGSEAGVSPRLRDFRKAEHGGHTVNRRRRGDPKAGWFEYQLVRADRPGQMRLIG